MKYKTILGLIFTTLLLINCNRNQEVRRPISHTSGTFMKKSIERNKKLVANQEVEIQNVIKNNPEKKFISSENGFWYSYEKRNLQDTIPPKKGDVAFFDYEIKDIYGKIIYSQAELRPQVYFVDKQDIPIGLREGIKTMHRGEKVNFLFPSHKAYGYHGDTKKIGTNIPLLITVTLKNYKSEAVYKKEQNNLQATNEAIIKNSVDKTTPSIPQKNTTVPAPTAKKIQTIRPNLPAKSVTVTKPVIQTKAVQIPSTTVLKPVKSTKPTEVAKPVLTEKSKGIIKPTINKKAKDSL